MRASYVLVLVLVRARGRVKLAAPPFTCTRPREAGGVSVYVLAPAPRSTSGVTVKRHSRVVKRAATGRELVNGGGSILFASSLLVSCLSPWVFRGEKFKKG